MTITLEITKKIKVPAVYLRAVCHVRYWEDAVINGVEDEEGNLTPCRVGETWSPTIDIAKGLILEWPKGTIASIHFKVCDEGVYYVLDADFEQVLMVSGYVPKIMSPQENGYGDYVIMNINGEGYIEKWNPERIRDMQEE